MTEFGSAKLLTPPHNYAVVQLPDRNYPGVVFQGDSLSSLFIALQRIHSELQKPETAKEALEELGYACDDLRLTLAHYEKVLTSHGIKRPYPKSVVEDIPK